MSSIAGKTRSVEPAGESTGLFASPGKRSVILCLLLVTATLVLYNPVIRHPFVNFDDDRYIVNNPQVQAGLSWHTIAWAFTSTEQANWHPLTWLSHALDCQLFHLNPAGHHYTNVLLHAVNAVLPVPAAAMDDGLDLAQHDGGGTFCLASHQRRVGGLDIGTQECAEHVVFPAGTLVVWMVCGQARRRTLPYRRAFVRLRPDGQADGDHVSLRVAALGLLAVAAYVSRAWCDLICVGESTAGTPARASATFLAGFGEAAFAGALRRQRSHHHEGTA